MPSMDEFSEMNFVSHFCFADEASGTSMSISARKSCGHRNHKRRISMRLALEIEGSPCRVSLLAFVHSLAKGALDCFSS